MILNFIKQAARKAIVSSAKRINKVSKTISNKASQVGKTLREKKTLTGKILEEAKLTGKALDKLNPRQTNKIFKKALNTDRLAKYGKYRVADKAVTKWAATKLADTASKLKIEEIRAKSIDRFLRDNNNKFGTSNDDANSYSSNINNSNKNSRKDVLPSEAGSNYGSDDLNLGNGRRK